MAFESNMDTSTRHRLTDDSLTGNEELLLLKPPRFLNPPWPYVPHPYNPSYSTLPNCILPSLNEFDRGVEALAERDAVYSRSVITPPNFAQVLHEAPMPTTPIHSYSIHNAYHSYSIDAYGAAVDSWPRLQPEEPQQFSHELNSRHSGCSRPNANLESKRPRRVYTTEQQDYLLHIRYDLELEWPDIPTHFAIQFREQKRSIKSLQAVCYRLSDKIPLCDDDGLLIFKDEDAVDPMLVTKNSCDLEPGEGGLVNRFPERALGYPWVSSHFKQLAKSLADKREEQRVRREAKSSTNERM